MRSFKRPGVATITSTPRLSKRACFSNPTPPYMVTTRMPHLFANRTTSSLTCTANSLVGTRISARGMCLEPLRKACTIGKAYAAVLPEPVSADPRMSRPSIIDGIAFTCISVGSVNPSVSRSSEIRLAGAKFRKFHLGFLYTQTIVVC